MQEKRQNLIYQVLFTPYRKIPSGDFGGKIKNSAGAYFLRTG